MLRLNYHVEVADMEELLKLEAAFAKEIQDRGEEFKYYQDMYGEHPDERKVKNVELNEKIKSVQIIDDIMKDLKGKVIENSLIHIVSFEEGVFFFQNEKLEAVRIPLNQETSPTEECFDTIVGLLKGTTASTPIVFNCQAGISRTTTGMIIAALIKEYQLSFELNQMKGMFNFTQQTGKRYSDGNSISRHRPRRHLGGPEEEEARPSRHRR